MGLAAFCPTLAGRALHIHELLSESVLHLELILSNSAIIQHACYGDMFCIIHTVSLSSWHFVALAKNSLFRKNGRDFR